MKITSTIVTAAALLAAASASADVVTIGASKDNTLYQNNAGQVSNGMGQHFLAGRSNEAAAVNRKRAVISFDVAAAVPAGATINSVTLTLRMSRSNQAGSTPVSLHRLLADWGEGASDSTQNPGQGAPAQPGDATWLHRFYPGVLWASPGGDYVAAPSATIPVGSNNGFYSWSSSQMAADVQGWLNTPAGNSGWIVIGDESTFPTAKRYDSRQVTQADRRPKLTIDFTPPANTGACCFGDGTCLVLTQANCGAQGGAYQGNATSCTPNLCPQPTGACCFSDGSCQELTSANCSAAAGTWQGPGTDCSPNPCPIPSGACCYDNASCAELTAANCAASGGTYQGDGSACAPGLCPLVLEPFVDALPVPGVLPPTSGVPGGEASYEVAITQFQQQLHRDLPPTTVWGVAGSYPGPTIEAGANLPVTVTWLNDLRDAGGNLLTSHYLPVDPCLDGAQTDDPRIVFHLHGAHVQTAYDGYPELTLLPGESAVYIYPNNQLPATLWYHDHALGITRLNVYMGLAGFYLLRDPFEAGLGLPSGEYEIPLAIQDRSFHPDGSWLYPAAWEEHFFGDVLLVNGKVWPYLNVKRATYRFRILNGSNSRTYALALSNGAPFHQLGMEGGLMAAPVTLSGITIGPGERADVMLDFSAYAPGTEIILENSAPAPYPGVPGEGVIPQVMKFIVASATGTVVPVPPALRPLETLAEQDAVRSREFSLRKQPEPCAGSAWLINDLAWHDITERPRLGTTEVWRFVNRSGVMHPMHMHLVMFQVLDRQDFIVQGEDIIPVGDPIPPDPNEFGWKDTVRTNPGQITRVIARFEDYTGLYPYHCHILEHEDHEMMRQFEALPPCPWDLDFDDQVATTDFLDLLGQWGASQGGPPDFDGNGFVDTVDFLELLAHWGACPG